MAGGGPWRSCGGQRTEGGGGGRLLGVGVVAGRRGEVGHRGRRSRWPGPLSSFPFRGTHRAPSPRGSSPPSPEHYCRPRSYRTPAAAAAGSAPRPKNRRAGIFLMSPLPGATPPGPPPRVPARAARPLRRPLRRLRQGLLEGLPRRPPRRRRNRPLPELLQAASGREKMTRRDEEGAARRRLLRGEARKIARPPTSAPATRPVEVRVCRATATPRKIATPPGGSNSAEPW